MYGYYISTISRQRIEIEQTISELGSGIGHRFVADAISIWNLFCEWQRRAQNRRNLAQMGAQRLDDIGITRAQADHEAGKVFWRS